MIWFAVIAFVIFMIGICVISYDAIKHAKKR